MTREERINLLKYMVAGAIGFGIGNSLLAHLLITNPVGPFTIFDAVVAIFGSITCGILLGITSKDAKKALKLSMAGVIWFIIGFVVYFPLMFIAVIFAELGAFFISPLVIGMIGGALFSIVLKKKIRLLAIACGIGCIIAFVISSALLGHIHAMVRYVAFGLIMGAFLGIGMYLAEKPPTNPEEDMAE
jgi:hypothetical protein